MIFIVNAENRACFEHELRQMRCHRKAVFVDCSGWPHITQLRDFHASDAS